MPQKGSKGVDRTNNRPVTFDGIDWRYDDANEDHGMMRGLLDAIGNVGIGAAKGLGQRASDLGETVSHIPGVGAITTGLGNALGSIPSRLRGEQPALPANSDAAFRDVNSDLEAHGTAQNVGKIGESIAEFAVPGPAVGRGLTEGLVRLIPDAASPKAMGMMNKGAAYAGRIGGDALTAGGLSMLHGDENPDEEMGSAAAGTIGGEVASEIVPLLLQNSMVRKILPVLLASGVGFGVGGPGGASLGGALGMYGAKRSVISGLMDNLAANPKAVRRTLQKAGRAGGSIAAGARSEYERSTSDSGGR